MAEPLKNLLHPGLVAGMAEHLARSDPRFDAMRFGRLATTGMESLELMQRASLIRDALFETLPEDFETAANILSAALPSGGQAGINGWALLPVNQYVAARGLDHFDVSLALLRQLTPHFTAEFGIRIFIHTDQARALKTISTWTADTDHHVRRLASEGTRPRLPWAMRLPKLIHDPQPILPVLTALMDDPEDYVRRSVANSLNDIGKDHPDLVADFVARHIDGASAERRWLLKHASRSLLKQGHGRALANFGYGAAKEVSVKLEVTTPVVEFGKHLGLKIGLTNAAKESQSLMVDYVIHHRKANGQTTPKVFKWKSVQLAAGETVDLARQHAMRTITTRTYYAGAHRVEIQVNGQTAATADFFLSMDGA